MHSHLFFKQLYMGCYGLGWDQGKLQDRPGCCYVAHVLNAHALPFIHCHGPGATLLQDNARPHVAGFITPYFVSNCME